MKTFSLKTGDIKRVWTLIDASEAPLGRVATVIATRLIGKYKPTFTPHVDDGDYVVVINSDKLVVTGDKTEDKTYYRHSGFPGGIKSRTLKEQQGLDSTRVIQEAVRGMIPKNKLSPERMNRLRVFTGEAHDHTAQQPKKLEIK